MSNLEEEDRPHSDGDKTTECGEVQVGILPNCQSDLFAKAQGEYRAIPIPGELNTRVRAAIESEERHRKHRRLFLLIAGIAGIVTAVLACLFPVWCFSSKQKRKK